MREELLKYEKRLLEDREQLLKLSEQFKNTEDKMMGEKIKHLESELLYMNKQFGYLQTEYLKGNFEKEKVLKEAEKPEHKPDMSQVKNVAVSVPQNVLKDVDIKPEKTQQSQAVINNVTVEKREPKADLEKTVGKVFMGIFASVLIFIGLIFFAIEMMPRFGDTEKQILMYLISFVFTGVGLVLLHKDNKNSLYLAITGCGVGAIYISMFMSNMYFKMLGDLPLYALITLWAIGVCMLSKLKDRVFQVIGHLGVVIAVFFGIVLCLVSDDEKKFGALVIFYAVAFGVFYFTHFSKEVHKNIMHHIFNMIDLNLLIFGCVFILWDKHTVYPAEIAITVIIAIHMLIVYCGKWKNQGICNGILTIFYSGLLTTMGLLVIPERNIFTIVMVVIALAFSVTSLLKNEDTKAGSILVQIHAIALALFGFALGEDYLFDYGFVILIAMSFMILGYVFKNELYRYSGIILYVFYILASDGNIAYRLIIGILVLALAWVLMYVKRQQYKFSYKLWTYVATLLLILRDVSQLLLDIDVRAETVYVIIYVIILAVNSFMIKGPLSKNPADGEKENPALYNIVNVILMLMGLIFIETLSDVMLHLVMIMATLVAFMMNVGSLTKKGGVIAGLYVGFKFTVYMNAVLSAFAAPGFLISICCILFAIACVVVGFAIKYKYIRIYGIILVMISVFKLTMIDMAYDDTLGYAISFFVSGLLCFGISMIYNFIDKRIAGENQ